MIPSLVSGLQHVGESLPGTLVTVSGVAINASPTPGTAGSGTLITITSGAQVAVGGNPISGTANVAALYYIGSTCFQENASNNWYGPVIAGNGGSGPLAAPQPTVTLSNSTVTAGAAAGSTVGTLSVTTGAGSYAWAYALSGTNSGSFQISGSTLQTSAVLSTGSYGPLTISASNNTVIGSPFTLSAPITVGSLTAFTIGTSVSTPTGNAINVNLTSQTGATVGPELFGVSQSTNNGTFVGSFVNSGWVSAMAALDLRSWRLQGEGLMGHIYGSPSSTTPNWTVLAPLVAHIRTALPNATLFWTLYDTTATQLGSAWAIVSSAYPSQCTQLATYLESHGIHVSYWDLFNEPDLGGPSEGVMKSNCSAVYPAMAALGYGYKFGTCPTGQNPINEPWQQDCITAYPGIFYLAGHCYAGPTDAGSTGQDLSWSGPGGANNPFNRNVTVAAETVSTGKLPFAMSEYQFGYSFLNVNGANQVASCAFGAMIAYGGQNNVFFETGVWDGAQSADAGNSTYAAGWGFSTATQGRHCFMLSNGGLHMQGNVVNANWQNVCNAAALAAATAAGATGSPQITVLATTGGLMVVNSDGATGTGNVTVALGGLLNTTLHQWQQSNSTPNTGTTTVISVTGSGANATIPGNFPALSVTMFYP